MSSQTTNLNLIKPAGTDFVNVADLNTNFDIIDSHVGTLETTVSQLQTSVSPAKITVTKSSKITTLVANAYLVGKICIIPYYFAPNTNLVRNDVIATFDISSNFKANFFNGSVNLAYGTKTMLADTTFQSSSDNFGIVVGVLEN